MRALTEIPTANDLLCDLYATDRRISALRDEASSCSRDDNDEIAVERRARFVELLERIRQLAAMAREQLLGESGSIA